jgi:hypothetical protein
MYIFIYLCEEYKASRCHACALNFFIFLEAPHDVSNHCCSPQNVGRTEHWNIYKMCVFCRLCVWTVVSLLFLFFVFASSVWTRSYWSFLSLAAQSPFSSTKFCSLHNVIFFISWNVYVLHKRRAKVSKSSSGAKELLIYSAVHFLHVVMWRITNGGTTLKNYFHEGSSHFFWQ